MAFTWEPQGLAFCIMILFLFSNQTIVSKESIPTRVASQGNCQMLRESQQQLDLTCDIAISGFQSITKNICSNDNEFTSIPVNFVIALIKTYPGIKWCDFGK